MLADPECVGELLLVGLAMARSIDLGDPEFASNGTMPMRVIAEQVYGRHYLPSPMLLPLQPRGDADPRRRLWDVFRQDRRRYDPDVDEGRRYRRLTCGRPMIRREGLCDRNASSQRRLTDPATGRRQWVGCCSQSACKRWFTDLLERNRRELAANPPPTPAANTGGVLERHLPEVDWWVVWKQVDPGWCPPPEGRPFGKPTLTVIVGGDEPEMSVPRPALTVIEGGRR